MHARYLVALSFGMRFILFALCWSVFCMQRLLGEPSYFIKGISDAAQQQSARRALNVNARNDEGLTGLMFAALYGEVALARALVNQGADLNLKANDSRKMTALHYAANALREPQSMEVGELLIEAYAYPRLKDVYGKQPIHLVVSTDILSDRTSFTDKLIKNGADINAQDKEGNTLIHIVASMKNSEWITILMERYGALINLSLKNKDGYTPYGYADSLGYTYTKEALQKPLEEFKKATQRFPSGLTTLMAVIMKGSNQLTDRFIKDKDALNLLSDDQYKNSALHIALLFNNIYALKALLDKGALVSIRNAKEEIPAMFLVRMLDKSTMIKAATLLFKKDPQTILTKNNNGDNILHYIVRFDTPKLLDFLLSKYRDLVLRALRDKNNALQTPFDLSEQMRRPKMRDRLLKLKRQFFIP